MTNYKPTLQECAMRYGTGRMLMAIPNCIDRDA